MSSHHIVREKQEPALLVLGLDNFDDEQLGQVLEWSPTIFATKLMAEKMNAQGIKVDWIVADDIEAQLQSDVKHLPTNGQNILEATLSWLISDGFPSVNVVTDEFHIEEYISYASQINLVIFFNQQKIYAINSGFGKWKPGGETITLLSSAQALRYTGLQSLGDNQYQTLADGFFTLQFNEPYLFIAEDI
jgi:thiamine pyrophosphokinase